MAWETHIKRPRADGKSCHADPSPCGDIGGAYVVLAEGAPLPDCGGLPYCVWCEVIHTARGRLCTEVYEVKQ